MVLEIGLWAFVPRSNLTVLFWVFVLNRILSGMAEAAASGADEALAYDSLKQEGDINDWGRVLERQIQVQSIGFVFAMTVGGFIYDPQLLQKGRIFLIGDRCHARDDLAVADLPDPVDIPVDAVDNSANA